MKTKQMWSIFGVAFLATLALQMYQVFTFTDFSTALENTTGVTTTLLVLFLLFVIIELSLCGSSKLTPEEYHIKTNVISGLFIALAGVSFIAYSLGYYAKYSISSISITTNINNIANIVCGVFFLFMALSSFMGKNLFDRLPVIALIPTIWLCIRLIFLTFIDYTHTNSSSVTKLMSISLIFMLIYFFCYIKLIAHQQTKNTYKRLFVIGLITIVATILYSVSTVIIWLASHDTSSLVTFMPAFGDLMIALYIFSTLIEISPEISKKAIPQIQNTSINMDASQKKEGYEIFDEIKSSSNAQRISSQNTNQLSHTITSNTSYFDKLVNVPIKGIESADDEIDNEDLEAANQVVIDETITIDKGAIEEALKKTGAAVKKHHKLDNQSTTSGYPKSDTNVAEPKVTMSEIDKLIDDILSDDK